MNKWIICPECGKRVKYSRRNAHKCFRKHLKDLEELAEDIKKAMYGPIWQGARS